MRIKLLSTSNFLAIGKKQVVDFEKLRRGIVSVSGPNGSGKSSLLESLYWCFVGELIRDVPIKGLVRAGCTACSVEIVFEDDGNTYRFSRLWSQSKKVCQLTKRGSKKDDKIEFTYTEGTAYILNLLGVSKRILQMSSFFGRSFTLFSRLSPSEATEFIELLGNNDVWKASKNIAQKQFRDSSEKVDWVSDRSETLERDLQEYRRDLERKQKIAVGIQLRVTDNTEIVEKQIANIADKFNRLEEQLTEMEKERTFQQEEKDSCHEEAQKWFDQMKAIKEDMRKTEKLIDFLAQDNCPTCFQPLESAEVLHKEMKKSQSETKALQDELDEVTHFLEQDKQGKAEAARRISQLTIDIQQLSSDLSEVKENDRRLKLALTKEENNTELAEARGKVSYIEDNLIPDIKTKIQSSRTALKLAKSRHTCNRFWVKSFQAIRYLVLGNIADILEAIMSDLIIRLGFKNARVQVDTFNKNEKPEVSINVEHGGTLFNMGALSEGERQRLDLACFLSCSMLLDRYLGIDLGFKVFDEPLHGLDEHSREAVFQYLANIDYDGIIFVIDHNATFENRFNKSIVMREGESGATVSTIN